MAAVAVRMRDIVKVFPHPERPVVACDGVSLDVLEGEIHGIVGENGAGKTTLMNILYGIHRADRGELVVRDTVVHSHSPRTAIALGIGMVHQHFVQVPSFTVGENLVFGMEPVKRGIVDAQRIREIAREVGNRYGLSVNPDLKIADCPLSIQQRVEILRALLRGARILIFDEPTSVLTPQETESLFSAFREMKREGRTILFISHKLREVLEICDRITVMRKGKVMGTVNANESSAEELATLMVGRKVITGRRCSDRTVDRSRAPLFQVKGLKARDDRGAAVVDGVSFELYPGEILGVAGVGGNGQAELVECLTGLRPIQEGTITYKGTDLVRYDAVRARGLGIAYITGQRYTRGLCRAASVFENLTMGFHRKRPWAGKVFLNLPKLTHTVTQLIQEYDIKVPSPYAPVMNLSGGNAQRCILARELTLAGDVIIAEEPTRGVDIAGTEFIHEQLVKKSQEGCGILLVSTDLDEILAISSRVIVMFRGRVVGEVVPDAEQDPVGKIGLMMAGVEAA